MMLKNPLYIVPRSLRWLCYAALLIVALVACSSSGVTDDELQAIEIPTSALTASGAETPTIAVESESEGNMEEGEGETAVVIDENEPITTETPETAEDEAITTDQVALISPDQLPLIEPDRVVAVQQEIVFPTGASSGSVAQEIAPGDTHIYSLYALGGQLVEVALSDDARFFSQFSVMLAPAGQRPIGIGLSRTAFTDEAPVLAVYLPEAGSYELILTAPDEWESQANYSMTVSIPPLDDGGSPSIPDNFVLVGLGLAQVVDIAGYSAVLYSNPDGFIGDGRVLVYDDSELVTEIPYAVDFNALNGEDITGTGVPNLIVEAYTGGAHCCSKTATYDLYEQGISPVLDLQYSECGGSFTDLDGDGVSEYLTCDDSFAYRYCSYVASPFPSVVMAFDGAKYVPVGAQFPGFYADEIASSVVRAQSAQDDAVAWDSTNKCGVLPAVLSYFYSGQGEAGRRIFNETYPHPDADIFWAEMMRILDDSPLYIAPPDLPNVIMPNYYRLESGLDCPDRAEGIRIMAADSSNCGDPIVVRDVFWLASSLQEAGLLQIEETVEFEDLDCVTQCALIIGMYDENGNLIPISRLSFVSDEGGIGYVLNESVDGSLLGSWRLRGDMSWERLE